ncbi:MAG: aminotransferase class V-fold PLP-dependent enzyme, partial [Clostridiales Family XIII bacterium]|nr:aminotransferase class V-fold PLP-dependent enzyme [Clostridiales Family XIII bacterium]
EAADFLSASAHKIHGPKGVGLLCARRPEAADALILGGGQEGGLRSGTENTPGIAGFGTAAEEAAAALPQAAEHVARVRARLLAGIVDGIPDIRIVSPEKAATDGHPGCCSPYILSVSFLGTRGEVLLHGLESVGIHVSTASACASIGRAGRGGPGAKNAKSHVLAAMGIPDREAEGVLRFSFSRHNTMEEMDCVTERLKDAVGRFRKIGSFR